MKSKIITILTLIALSIQYNCYPQDNIPPNRDVFISLNSGIYLPTKENFKEEYGSHFILTNGISLGIPIINNSFFFYGKAMYFQKKGVPIIYHYESQNGVDTFYTSREGEVVWKQLNVNLGIQYSLEMKNSNKIFFNGGFLIIKASRKSTLPLETNSTAKGVAGCFIGVGYEKKLQNKPMALFTECQYNFDRRGIWLFNSDYGGANINVGIRYYFNIYD